MRYTEQTESNVQKSYTELVPTDDQLCGFKEWYISHHAALSSKRPDKVRSVYDCAAFAEGKFLNGFLMKHPESINSLVGVLLRFKKEEIPNAADVEAIFHEIRVLPPNRDALRVFWWPVENLEAEPFVFLMMVHLIGSNSSPSCACHFSSGKLQRSLENISISKFVRSSTRIFMFTTVWSVSKAKNEHCM